MYIFKISVPPLREMMLFWKKPPHICTYAAINPYSNLPSINCFSALYLALSKKKKALES